jgi:hypothetical protein
MEHLKSPKSEAILNTLSPLEPKVQRYIALLTKIDSLMSAAEDENDACVPIELVAELFVLQDELYKEATEKHKEAN